MNDCWLLCNPESSASHKMKYFGKCLILSRAMGSSKLFFSSKSGVAPIHKVVVSQSQNKWANTALEDWMARHVDLSAQNVLVLSKNNADLGAPCNITATFLADELLSKPRFQDRLVFSPLPATLPLASLPTPQCSAGLLEGGSHSVSIQVDISEAAKHKDVLEAMTKIAQGYLDMDASNQKFRRLSLVRPDDGWFPGIGALQAELETVVQQIDLTRRNETKKRRKHRDGADGNYEYKIANSFGQ